MYIGEGNVKLWQESAVKSYFLMTISYMTISYN